MSKKYNIIIFGCQMNISDGERVSAVLENMDYKQTQDMNKADLIAIIMCSVRQSAVDRIFGLAEKLKKLKRKPKTILTGCMLKKDKKTFSEKFDYVVDIKKLLSEPINFFEARETPNGEVETKKNLIGERNVEKSLSPSEELLPSETLTAERALAENLPASENKKRKYITISNGCNNYCTYCVVPYTRGRLICRDHKKIIQEAKELIKSGVKELWLLGQNVNDYACPSDNSVDFPELLKMVNALPGDFKIFFMSPNPKNFSDKLIKIMAGSEKFSKYLNLPVQAGDDEVLKKMNRPYTSKQYLELVKKIRKAVPDINLSTDVIVGFPGETKKQFENTVKLFKKAKFNIAYINKYSPRRGTTAFKTKDDVPWPEKKRREKILMELVNAEK